MNGPTRWGADPYFANINPVQRNVAWLSQDLQITLSDNPGSPATHLIPQTFDLRPA